MSGRPRVVVTGTGILTALGDRPLHVHRALCAGEDGLVASQSLAAAELGRAGELRVGELRAFDPREILGEGNFRPLDHAARLAASGAKLALDDAGWTPEARQEVDIGLVLGTMFGSLRTIAEFDRRALTAGPSYAKPMVFANSVINAAAGQTAIWHGLRGVNATVSGGAASGLQALAYATEVIRSGRATALLAGGSEELCFESLYGFQRAGWLAGGASGGAGKPAPFHADRDGFAPGEAVAFLMLEEERAARDRGARIVAEILGHGTAFDVSRGRDEAGWAAAVARAVGTALDDAVSEPGECDALSASANGSVLGDRCEAAGVAAVFGQASRTLPVTALKSQLGETLGAAGALQAILLIEALHAGVLPGIPGLDRTEAGFALSKAGPEPHTGAMRRGLVSSLGLQGKACSLVVEIREPEPRRMAGASA